MESYDGWFGDADLGTGDTKAGTLVGTDRFGNKYYENMTDELPRTACDPSLPNEQIGKLNDR